MIDALPPEEQIWLKHFFSGRNALHWDAFNGGNAPVAWMELVSPWIAAFAARGHQLPLVLPVFDARGACQWYGMAADDVSAAALAQELMAVVGPSYSNFCGQALQADDRDEIESALQERFGRFVFRLDPVDVAARDDIKQALQFYLGLLLRRPNIPDRSQRPFGKIRADFDRALLAGNEADAHRLRDELIASGRIDAEQHKYLDIRLLAGLGRQRQLAHDYPLIKSVLGLSLPTQTIVDVVEALYETHIADIENNPNVDSVLTVFQSEIAHHFGPLFRERKGIRQANVLKAFLLYEMVQEQPNVGRCEAIVAAYPPNAGRELVDLWFNRLVSTPSSNSDAFELARQALGDDEYELALQLSLDAFPQAWTYSVMLRCAAELQEAKITSQVLDAVGTASDAIRATWTKRDLARWQQLQSALSEAPEAVEGLNDRYDSGWLSWASYVESGCYTRSPQQILEEALPLWSVVAYISRPEDCRLLAEKIGNASGEAERVFRDAFAPLVEFFVDRPAQSVRGFVPLYTTLIRIVAWSGTVSANELELASILVQALISLGPSKADYSEALDAYSEMVTANNAPGNIDWALNAAEILALHASPDNEARLRFFMAVLAAVRVFAHRLNRAQHAILSLLAKDYGCVDLLDNLPVPEGDTETASLTDFGGLIGIYTLTEPAGQRARQFLQRLLPVARVEVNSDGVATDKLKHLAANADIFVFAWKSSKHQAYYAAKDARGNRKILLPLGKGSASILDCVLGELRRIS